MVSPLSCQQDSSKTAAVSLRFVADSVLRLSRRYRAGPALLLKCLSFNHWVSLETGFDGGQLMLSDDPAERPNSYKCCEHVGIQPWRIFRDFSEISLRTFSRRLNYRLPPWREFEVRRKKGRASSLILALAYLAGNYHTNHEREEADDGDHY